MSVYSLIIGINDYPVKPLFQCEHDARKMQAYLKSLPAEVGVKEPLLLLNDAATKSAIETAITNHLGKAGDDDVALLYYSGHGVQEYAAGRFSDEHDGLLECIVSCPKKDQHSGYLLADKEIRYLFSQFSNNPHLVTIFDCCHSGDAVRSGGLSVDTEEQNKRLVQTFPARPYKEFLFSGKLPEATLKTGALSTHIPYKNSVHISACSAKEFSWEDNKGGVFTRCLLQLLASSNSQVTYAEIARWANISLKNITDKKQSPLISVQGKGAVGAYSPWLNMASSENDRIGQFIVYNEGKGWHLNRGSLLGMKPGAKVTITHESEKYDLKIVAVEIDTARLEAPHGQPGLELDRTKKYSVELAPSYATLRLYVNDIDGIAGDRQRVAGIIAEHEGVELGTAENAEYLVNIFNEFVYISQYNDPFRPLVKQISLLKGEEVLVNEFRLQLKYLVKWNHFDTLVNTDNRFAVSPIKVEVCLTDGDTEWHDVTNGTHVLEAWKQRLRPEQGNYWARAYQMRVTNTTDAPLFVGVLELGPDLSISSGSWGGRGIELEGKGKEGDSIFIFNHIGSQISSFLDPYQEVYNWEHNWTNFQFIVNNYEDLTPSITDYLQPGLETPIILSTDDPRELNRPKGMIGGNLHSIFKKKWGTVKAVIKLQNPEYNKVSGPLSTHWKYYIEREEIAPFINRLYLMTEVKGLSTESKSLPTQTGEDGVPKGLISDVGVGLANYFENKRRKRRFERLRMEMPDQPVIVAEGDSWFLYPFFVKDILDYLMESFPVLSIAAAGDELGNYKIDGHLLRSVAETRPKYVLISGGGNDIIGPEIEHILANNVPSGKEAQEYLNDKFKKNLERLRKLYKYFIDELKKHDSVEQLFVHGYDYIRVDHLKNVVDKGWVNRYMLASGIASAEDRNLVIRHLIDSFNEILADLAQDDPFVTYINLRGQVKAGQWYDEIHPNDRGYETVSKFFTDAINARQ